VKVNVSGCDCVALEDSGCQVPIVSDRKFEWCCGDAVGKVTLHGFGRSHTVQAPLVNLTVRVNENGCAEAVEIPLVCAVTELRSADVDMILPADVVCKLKATPRTVSASCADVSVVSGEGSEIPKVVTEEGTPEEVDESVAGVEVCVTGCDVNGENVVKIDDVVTSTPARVSCNMHSVRGEEARIVQPRPEQRRKSSPSLERSSDRCGGCPGRRNVSSRRWLTSSHVRRGRGVSRTLPPTSQKSVPRSVVHVTRDVSGRQSVPRPVSA